MFEPYALIPLAWSYLLIGRIANGLLSLGQYERMEVWCRATVKNMIWQIQKSFRFSIIHFVVQRLLSHILPRPFCFTWLFQFLCFLQQQKCVHSHSQGGTLLLEILFLMRSGIMLLVATKLSMFTPCRCFKMFFKSRCSLQD